MYIFKILNLDKFISKKNDIVKFVFCENILTKQIKTKNEMQFVFVMHGLENG